MCVARPQHNHSPADYFPLPFFIFLLHRIGEEKSIIFKFVRKVLEGSRKPSFPRSLLSTAKKNPKSKIPKRKTKKYVCTLQGNEGSVSPHSHILPFPPPPRSPQKNQRRHAQAEAAGERQLVKTNKDPSPLSFFFFFPLFPRLDLKFLSEGSVRKQHIVAHIHDALTVVTSTCLLCLVYYRGAWSCSSSTLCSSLSEFAVSGARRGGDRGLPSLAAAVR